MLLQISCCLCRTERMFNAKERLPLVIDMILAEDCETRKAALDKLSPIQRQDFVELFTAMSPRPVTVRLLDPPMHEFLPSEHQLQDELHALKHYETIVRGQRVTGPIAVGYDLHGIGRKLKVRAILFVSLLQEVFRQ